MNINTVFISSILLMFLLGCNVEEPALRSNSWPIARPDIGPEATKYVNIYHCWPAGKTDRGGLDCSVYERAYPDRYDEWHMTDCLSEAMPCGQVSHLITEK